MHCSFFLCCGCDKPPSLILSLAFSTNFFMKLQSRFVDDMWPIAGFIKAVELACCCNCKNNMCYLLSTALLLLETSALSGAGIEAAFITIAKAVLQKIDQGKLNPNKLAFGAQRGSLDTLTPTKEPAAKSKCC
eukprot:c8392_g1_i2.p1 GENE.c8392_g1_i2~~c8392_g1_i2.p1  ORF type:complete len:133 (-),score=15.37 c8392_g1_i2:262-660(-)